MTSEEPLIAGTVPASQDQINKTANSTDVVFVESETLELTLDDKVDRLLNEIHGSGRFSCFAFFALVTGMNATGYFFYLLSYLTLQPKYYKCVFTDPQPLDPEAACIDDNICSDRVVSYEIDWSSIYSIHNWVEKLDLICCPGWKVGMMGSMVFVGWVVTLPWVPRLSDMYGRKMIFNIGMLIDLAMFIIMFFTTKIDSMIMVTFMFGLATTIRVNIGFVYMMELMPKRNQTFYGSAYNVLESSVLLLGTLYFWFVSKQWIYFTLFGFGLQIFSVITIQFLPESPRLMVELGRLDEAKASFEKIAKWNGQELHWNEEDFRRTATIENSSKTGQRPLSYWLKQKRILINLVVMTLFWLTTSFNFYLIQFLLTSFEQVYLTTIYSCASDMLAYVSAALVFKCLGVKKSQLLGFTIASLGGVIILIFGLSHQDYWYFPVMVLFAKYGVTLSFGVNYISNAYMFPTLFAATALGFCNTVARLFSALSPIFAQMDEPLPMILFTGSSMITLTFVFCLQVPNSSPDELLNKLPVGPVESKQLETDGTLESEQAAN